MTSSRSALARYPGQGIALPLPSAFQPRSSGRNTGTPTATRTTESPDSLARRPVVGVRHRITAPPDAV
ncbi:hypothetical protein HBB16_02345 [Pseudonocardia sp. MCCB 268]|nr:hypothetical protein [Pseudonocardia cytotoxica]